MFGGGGRKFTWLLPTILEEARLPAINAETISCILVQAVTGTSRQSFNE